MGSGSAQMFSEGDIGVLPPLGVLDPLGLIETRDMRRYEIMEIKHGRAAMLGFLGVVATEGPSFPWLPLPFLRPQVLRHARRCSRFLGSTPRRWMAADHDHHLHDGDWLLPVRWSDRRQGTR